MWSTASGWRPESRWPPVPGSGRSPSPVRPPPAGSSASTPPRTSSRSRALVQEDIYESFMADAVARVEKMIQGNPLDTETQVGAQASNDQLEKILSYIDIGKQEGAKVLTGGARAELPGDLAGGYYVQPTVFEGHNKMRIFQEEIFGPVVAVTRFSDYNDAMGIANDTLYGLGAGVWS